MMQAQSPPALERKRQNSRSVEIKRKTTVPSGLIFWGHLLPSAAALVIGVITNGGRKYVRLLTPGHCSSLWGDIFAGPEASICCLLDDLEPEGICRAASLNWTTTHLTRLWVALLVPILGFIMNTSTQTPSRVLEPHWDVTLRHLRRFLLYAFIIVWRTFGLYKGLNWLQVQLSDAALTSSSCWYSSQTRSGLCKDSFDFSDHVVLFMAQYISIQMFETCAILHENRKRGARSFSIIVTNLISFAALGGMTDTVAFYHTQRESVYGFIVAVAGVYVPLWIIISGRAASVSYLLNPGYYINIQ